jgi:hypothetical protein
VLLNIKEAVGINGVDKLSLRLLGKLAYKSGFTLLLALLNVRVKIGPCDGIFFKIKKIGTGYTAHIVYRLVAK